MTQRLRLTFARASVVQVEPVSPLCALQVTFSRKELTGRVVCLVVCPAHLRQEGQDDGVQRRKSPADSILLGTYTVEVVHTGGTLRRLLAHAPRLTVGIEFARLSTLTGEVGARI